MKRPSSTSAGRTRLSPCIQTPRIHPTNRFLFPRMSLSKESSLLLFLASFGSVGGAGHHRGREQTEYGREHTDSMGAPYVQWLDRLYASRTGMRSLLCRVDG